MSTLDMFVPQPVEAPTEPEPKPVPMPRGYQGTYTPAHSWTIIRPEPRELMEMARLDQEEFREAYRDWTKAHNHGIRFSPDWRAWSLWHKHHDKVVVKRGLV